MTQSRTSYYPTFGSPMPTRTWSDPNGKYKYGFNGKEKDNEVNVEGGDYDFGARIYDSRLGRWLSLDPLIKKYPNLTPYNSLENSPLFFKEDNGEDAVVTITPTTIVVSTKIFIYGKDANAETAANIQAGINEVWSKENWTYTDENGKVYNVKFEVSVEMYKEQNPLIIPDAWDPTSTNNYIEIDNSEKKSNVMWQKVMEVLGQVKKVQKLTLMNWAI